MKPMQWIELTEEASIDPFCIEAVIVSERQDEEVEHTGDWAVMVYVTSGGGYKSETFKLREDAMALKNSIMEKLVMKGV